MRIAFTKMHGLGNDFVVLDARDHALPPLTRDVVAALADRHTGIGCDQLVLIEPSQNADWRMRIFNSDGGEVEACGNATRAVGLLIGGEVSLETLGGTIVARPDERGIAVDMGEPRFDWDVIPLGYAMDTLAMPVGWPIDDGELENPVAVNVGNPHAVFFVDDAYAIDLASIGPVIENDPIFPERVNVNVAAVTARDAITLRVWERGAGITRACGTGACATAIAAMRRGLVDREVTVTLPGGSLVIAWGADNRITMTGPATVSYTGSFDWGDYA
ncbi:diaminopimelate epimerase [Croceicoccus gelatinilyticus]|uniref:diaminopimelate epimerase n=1 Tax=Croceicoccus gelatinilyticus TaxID=2835536 RepID=UPI001BCFEFAC|nr:diaminopimelate epimerase [Croceicoccus gelatinilyticus]MBS7670012.1 diaminopimelate epimerase [Croceicoccus gelatinilyticus]